MKDYTKGRSPEMLEPFFPNEMFKHVIVSCFLLVVEFAAVFFFPLPFKLIDKPDNVTWFLLPFYKFSRLINNEVLFMAILAFCALAFISWPFLESGRLHNLLAIRKAKVLNSYQVRHIPGQYNLWQKPVQFSVVIITILSMVQLCFMSL